MTPAVLFDIDGTLVSFEFDVKGTRRSMIDELSKQGFDTSTLTLASPSQSIMESAFRQVSEGSVPTDRISVKKSLHAILDAFEAESSKDAKLFEGTTAALDELKHSSTRLAVVTNSGRAAALDVLGRNGLTKYFEFVLTRDDVDEMKPSPGGLLKAVEMLSLVARDVLYVGDSLYDILAGKAAGMRVISIASGNYTADKLKSEGADYVLHSISELPRFMATWMPP